MERLGVTFGAGGSMSTFMYGTVQTNEMHLEITVSSRISRGSRGEPMNRPSHAEIYSGESGAPLRVLLVDDDPQCREAGCALLSLWGIDPVVACNGIEALQLVRERDFDIVLMDVAMPVMDGLAATEKIRCFEQENPLKVHVPVVAYTSRELPLSATAWRLVGLSDVLEKPSDADAMSKCLSRWCGSKFSPTLVC